MKFKEQNVRISKIKVAKAKKYYALASAFFHGNYKTKTRNRVEQEGEQISQSKAQTGFSQHLLQQILPKQLGPALCVSMPHQQMDLIVWPR